MELTTNHYVPILKWRRAEQGALSELRDDQKVNITPLIEVVMPKPNSEQRNKDLAIVRNELISLFRIHRVPEIVKDIKAAWGTSPVFIDLSLLYTWDLKHYTLNHVMATSHESGMKLIPVINISDDESFISTALLIGKKYGTGVCIRLSEHDLSNIDESNEKLESIFLENSMHRKDVDLLVDLKENCDDYSYNKGLAASQSIDNLSAYRSFIFAGGSFPLDLSKCKIDEMNMLPRLEWVNWLRYSKSETAKRVPTFSDYAIRHPIHNEEFQFFNSTASIKYTVGDNWWVLKGRVRQNEHYLAHAVLIKRDNSRFYGENYSAGDKYLSEKAAYFSEYIKNPAKKGTGAAEQWIKMGINHHLAVVGDQLSKTP